MRVKRLYTFTLVNEAHLTLTDNHSTDVPSGQSQPEQLVCNVVSVRVDAAAAGVLFTTYVSARRREQVT